MKHTLITTIFLLAITNVYAQTSGITLYQGTTLFGTYKNITEAYAAIPPTITESYAIEIGPSHNYQDEVYPIVFTEKAGASSTNRINIRLSPTTNSAALVSEDSTQPVIIFDGADWVVIDGVHYPGNLGMGILYDNVIDIKQPLIRFVNGATHNHIENIHFYGEYNDLTIDPLVELGTSPAHTEGNSDNMFRYCNFSGNSYGILSSGTPANPNNRNTIFSCYFRAFAGISLQEGTGKTNIEKNYIDVHSAFDTSKIAGIIIQDISDTTTITHNAITVSALNYGTSNSMAGIEVNSTPAQGSAMMSNNIISIMSRNDIRDTSLNTFEDTIALLAGIHLNANSKMHAGIYHNTITLAGINIKNNHSGIGSAAVCKTGNATGGSIDIRNNIFNNERTARNNNAHHVALAIADISGAITLDYNIYNTASGDYTWYNGQAYNNIIAYQNTIGNGQEVNTTDMVVKFIAGTYLAGSMYNKPKIKGTVIPGITTDYAGEIRTYPYRGADELTIKCSGTPPKGTAAVTSYATTCATDSVYIQLGYSYQQQNNIDYGGRFYQWQSKPLGSTQPFTDIPGAETPYYLLKMKGSTLFRIKDSCLDGSPAIYSNTDTFIYEPKPVVDSITAKRNGLTYFFSAIGAKDVLEYKWKFGDGDSSSLANPVHTYAEDKSYNVTLTVSNECGYGYGFMKTENSTGIMSIESQPIEMYPNPADEKIFIKIKGEELERLVLYNYQGTVVHIINTIKSDSVKLNTDMLVPGLYLLKATSGSKVYSASFTVAH